MAPFVGGKMLGNDFMQIKQYVFNEDTGGSTHICDLPYGLLYAEIMKWLKSKPRVVIIIIKNFMKQN